MLLQTAQYLKFIFKSTNQHGVHSPFVFDLVTKCFYDKTGHEAYTHLANFRRQLLKDNTKIRITDLGAGSHITKQSERRVRDMAKHTGTTYNRAKLLYRLANYFKPNQILELGTSLGIATHAMSLGHPKAKITTIEGCPNISKFARAHFKKEQLSNIHLVTGNFNTEIKNQAPKTYDLIFFDGNHQKEVTLSYFETLLHTAHNNSVFIFDDIYWSKGMTEAWETIKQHPKVTVTIDTFFWGFVFFRKEQPKEHFVIRV